MVSVFTRRIIAYILDYFVVSAVISIISFFIFNLINPKDANQVFNVLLYVMPVLTLIYFIYCEKTFGATIGKSIMSLEVKSKNGYDINWMQAIVRNLTKLYWFPIIFDWLIGKLLHTDRILNNITRTTVVEYY